MGTHAAPCTLLGMTRPCKSWECVASHWNLLGLAQPCEPWEGPCETLPKCQAQQGIAIHGKTLQYVATCKALSACQACKSLQSGMPCRKTAKASQADTHPCTGHALSHLQDLVSHGGTCCTFHAAGHGKALQVMGTCCITLELAGHCTAL